MIVILTLLALLPVVTEAGQAGYVYDELGRLIRVVDEQGQVAIYNYDPVGNLLSIQRTTASTFTPTINSITPNSFNRGTQTSVTLAGQNFLSGTLTTTNPSIAISNVVLRDQSISAVFTTALTAATGTFQATVTTFSGSASIPITISQQSVAPSNLTVQDGNQQVILDWDDYAQPNFEGFHVYRGTASGGPYTRLTTSLITTSYFRDQTVTNGTTYYYVVTATQLGFSESGLSNQVQAAPQGSATTVCTTITTNTTWRLTGSPFRVTCDLTIINNAVLTVDPGVEVRFSTGTGVTVGFPSAGGAGGLSAIGTAAGPIVFTSDQSSPAPGNWKGLNFTSNTIDASTRLDRVTVEYGGAGTNNANVRLDNAEITIVRSTIRQSSGHGIRLQTVSGLTLDQSTVTQNAGYGLIQESTILPVSVTSSSMTNNGAYPLRIGANGVALLNGNTYSGNNPNAIEVIGGSVTTTQTWRNQGVPFIVITSDMTVSNSAVLTLEAGLELRFSTGLGLVVGLAGQGAGSGTLSAVGTAAAPVTFTSAQPTRAPGDWKGVRFANTAFNDAAILDYVVVEYGGSGTSAANIHLDNVVSPARAVIRRSTARYSSGQGIRLQGTQVGEFDYVIDHVAMTNNAAYGFLQDTALGIVTLTGNTIQNNGSYPIKVRADIVGRLSGNTYGGNNPNAIEVLGQGLVTTQTWRTEGVPYVITGADVTVQSGAVLTMNPGVETRFANGLGLTVGVQVVGGTGGLVAIGTAADPIIFTSNQASPVPGAWKGLDLVNAPIAASTQLDHIIVEYGGGGSSGADIRINNNSLTVQHAAIRHSSAHGIRLTGSVDFTIQNSDVSQNAGYGIRQEGTNGLLAITGSTVQNNGSYPVRVRANSVGQLGGNTYSGNSPNAIEVFDASVTTTQTWRNEGVPYVVSADVNITSGAVLTLEPGLMIRFGSGFGFSIGAFVAGGDGGLYAVGTSAAPIVLTSNQTSPVAGDWDGLSFAPNTIDASTRLDYVVIEYGGAGGNNSNIRLNNAAFPIQHSTIRNSSGYGIHATGSSPAINFNSITNHALYGVFNATSSIILDAENNWWGDASGPTHSSNPGGSGSPVSNFVDFTPWLTSPP